MMAGCGTTTRDRSEKYKKEKAALAHKDSLALKIAVTPTLDCLPLFVAASTGIFDSLQVDVSLKEQMAQMDCEELFTNGRVECTVSDLMRTERLRHKGVGIDYLTATSAYWQMLGNQKSRTTEIKHLGDKMVGMTRYSATDYLATLGIDSVKPDLPVFRIQVNDVSVRLMMLVNNEIEAVMLTEPQATEARMRKHHLLMDSRDKDIRLGVIATRSKLQADPYRQEQLKKLVAAYNLACDSINTHGMSHYTQVITKYCKTTPEVVRQLPKMTFHHTAPPREKDIARTQNVKWRTY